MKLLFGYYSKYLNLFVIDIDIYSFQLIYVT